MPHDAGITIAYVLFVLFLLCVFLLCSLYRLYSVLRIFSVCDACDPEKLEILLQSAQENNLLLKDVQGSIKGTVNFMKTEFDILGNNDKQLLQKAQENNYKMDNLMSLSKKLENQDQDILKDTKTLLQNAKDLDANDKKMIKTMEKQGRTLQEIMGSLSTIKAGVKHTTLIYLQKALLFTI